MNTTLAEAAARRALDTVAVSVYRGLAELPPFNPDVVSDRAPALPALEASIPTLVALRDHFEGIRRAELTRLERKLAALSPEVRTRLDEITRLIVEKLLLTATEQLKSVGDGPMRARYAGALNRLFQLAAEHEDKVEDSERRLHNAIDVLQQRID